MKKLVYIALLMLPFAVAAQTKILEKSAKKAPSWLVSTGKDYFVSTNIAPSLSEAKELCLADIKKQIISAVAENIKASTAGSTSQTTQGQAIVEFLDKFDSKYETRSAILPFVNGISMSKVEDFYYQKLEDKPTGKITYTYSILYPFSSQELNSLITKFRKQDAEMEAKLNEQAALMDKVTTTEQIDRCISTLTPLLDYFFDDVRINKTKNTIKQFRKLYDYITPVMEEGSIKGTLRYSLMLDGRRISSSTKPTIKSNCATEIMAQTADDYVVTVIYNADGCLSSEENYIDVSYRFTGGSTKKRFYADMAVDPMKVSVIGQLSIKLGESTDSTTHKGVEVELQINNQGDSEAILEGLSFTIPELRNSVTVENQQIAVKPGISKVKVSSQESVTLNSNTATEFKLPVAKGSITILNPKDGAKSNISLANKYVL